ncbi:hypothetical protein K1T35_35205 [Pseudonocardia sp. DSM 110487]|uniref:hypothetical protein n=1 Tax=Pseudonocardia sp. DSM 110487 TaxID=2865833 RepID=UPI001C6A4418|nr:hypothetical protein [Pseudonocardia sp. DSM 110487]QYN33686.1 hypothetical protein K1T35_35205 [Pseudonocardia sp. DSM 110487]
MTNNPRSSKWFDQDGVGGFIHRASMRAEADGSIDLAKPDENYGLFSVPERPTPDEEAQLTWRPGSDAEGQIEFDVIIRGRITIDGLRIDCNMGNQGLAPSPPAPNVAEYSTMLGFRGRAFTLSSPGEVPRRIAYVGFESVELTNLVIENGGFSGDVWISRGGFYQRCRWQCKAATRPATSRCARGRGLRKRGGG